jgi:hypothetical protein
MAVWLATRPLRRRFDATNLVAGKYAAALRLQQ